ncbi:MAG: HAMP domain-containing protein [Acidobacteria bacterium]|nr:HAMP domain-containing protein [Acidobacteriota bacterium]
MRRSSYVSRSATRLAAGGLVMVLGLWLGGHALERHRFGADETATRARVATAVEATVRRIESRLQAVVDRTTVDLDDLELAAQGEASAERRLFEALLAATRDAPAEVAASLHGVTAHPVAWTGRPVELPDARVLGPAAVFLAPDAQGLRIVRVQPLFDTAEPARRAGALVLQAPLAQADRTGRADDYVLPTGLVGVAVRPHFEGGGEAAPDEFSLRSASGEPLASVSVPSASLGRARLSLRRGVRATLLAAVAIILLLGTGPLLDWRRRARAAGPVAGATLAVALLLATAHWLFGKSIDLGGLAAAPLVPSDTRVGHRLLAFFASPLHFLATSLLVGGFVGLGVSTLDRWRQAHRRPGRTTEPTPARVTAFLASQVLAGALVAALVVGYEAFIRHGVARTPIDILHYGLRPWDWARLAVLSGVIALNVSVVALGVSVLRLARPPWARGATSAPALRLLTAAAWFVVPFAVVAPGLAAYWAPTLPALLALGFIGAVAWRIGRIRARLRHASQAARLLAAVLALVLPSLAFYPSMVDAAARARRGVVETIYAPEVLEQRRTLQARLAEALANIDQIQGLEDLVRAADPMPPGAPPVDAAFRVWSETVLARRRLTSSVELYNAAGVLVSRFALKLPDITGAQTAAEGSCEWDIFEEVSPFFAEERRLLHAGRGICVSDPGGRRRLVGQVVVHLMLDYGNLSFVSAQSPYVALLRSGFTEPAPPPRTAVTFAVYGWSRKVLYASQARAWPLGEEAFRRASADRVPFWTALTHDGRAAEGYVLNDRGGIYVLSTWTDTGFGHLVVMAELVSLAFLAFVTAVLAATLYGTVAARTPTSGRALMREVRASFYRKLFLAFVAAAVVPVVALAFVARAYFAALMFADIEMEATRTAGVASRVVEDFSSLQVRGLAALPVIDDNIVVWLSRVIAEDVNIFEGPGLVASSERNLFASGLLSTRTPGEAYRAILLDGRPSFVGREAVGPVEYLVAAAPVRIQARDALLMVPLTSRQKEIEGQIEELDRRVLLAALLFIMLGAGIGYSMAERIADPVNRLMRATRRIARGDLDAHVVATSNDELRRLVEAFNSMAEDLRRQRAELERTNRLAAWADMARQVAHDIKNPLTPIQLNAEHLARVHADRGRPLGPVVDDCIASILGQVRLLRQISAEFSSFASSPQPRPQPQDLAALVNEIVEPYRAGLAGRVRVEVDLGPGLPAVRIDRLLVSRALTNVIENALHAMPNGGRLRFTTPPAAHPGVVHLSVEDTGVGMDAQALGRIFEPYFSTKATGTGLGLTIAKRNVEASGGRIAVESTPGAGTTVTMALPVA